jgi:hypothetical protein
MHTKPNFPIPKVVPVTSITFAAELIMSAATEHLMRVRIGVSYNHSE